MKFSRVTIAFLNTVLCYLCIVVINSSCGEQSAKSPANDSLAMRKIIPPAPVLSPEESIKKMHVENGFAVKLVAAEPMVMSPVAMSFDAKGRLWVVEMQDYMNDTIGTGEDVPTGKIVILSDTNHDGKMDTRTVFLDSLLMPRAICLVENGILVAEPPKLWFYRIENDKPVNKKLVDSTYAEGGNVEHQPNTLLRGLDNWIYSAKSKKRYRKNGDKWLIETTHFRGQWGLTQDDEGRLYYNTNTENLLGDYFSAGTGAGNDHLLSVAGYDEKIITDNKVFPVRPTPGVNRGYMKGILDDSLRLVDFTAACAPLYFNNNSFGNSFYGNVFVAEPSANLIKRNLLKVDGNIVSGEQAYHSKEFIASEDERFRPVNLYTGPDGALYIIDMYRGIIQHKTYLTPYLKNEIRERELTKPLNAGRIYKVIPNDKTLPAFVFPNDTRSLVELLNNKNGSVRYRTQQLLIDKGDKTAAVFLRSIITNSKDAFPVIHALWTLEGLHLLKDADVLPILKSANNMIRKQALTLVPAVINKKNCAGFISLLNEMIGKDDSLSAPYISYLLKDIYTLNAAAAEKLIVTLGTKYPRNIFVADGIISSLKNKEEEYSKKFLLINPDTTLAINREFRKVISSIAASKNNTDIKSLEKLYPKGAALFHSVCQTCHGAEGNGVTGLAPPLNNSNWVQGNKDKLIAIVLYGLNGPVNVAGKLYKAPEITGEMPGIGSNKEISDEEVAQVLSYIRSAWSNKASNINMNEVATVRSKLKNRSKSFTVDELNK